MSSCAGCGTESDALKPSQSRRGLFCVACRKQFAGEHGRRAMSMRSEEEKTALGERGGNALMQIYGKDYYSWLGRYSAQVRAQRRLAQASV